jgi:hypothetical protein
MTAEKPSPFAPFLKPGKGPTAGVDLTEGMPDELAKLSRAFSAHREGAITAEQLAALLLTPKQILDTLEAVQDPDETLRRLGGE